MLLVDRKGIAIRLSTLLKQNILPTFNCHIKRMCRKYLFLKLVDNLIVNINGSTFDCTEEF